MKKRTILACGAIALSAIGAAMAESAPATPSNPPNILFIHMEDMGQQIGPYGDHTAYTPNLNRLAEEGIVFRNANVVAPTCAASRGSLFTGIYPHQNGIMGFVSDHGFRYREGVPTFVQRLSDAGYYTGITYKHGIAPGGYVPFDHNFNWRVNALHPDDNQNEAKNAMDNFQYFMENRPQDRPFYFQAQHSDTHHIWVGGKRERHWSIEGMPGADVYPPIDSSTVRALPHFGPDVELNESQREYLAGYYTAIQRVDYFVGRVLSTLEEHGEAENTVVIFSADHGPSHMARNKETVYELGLQVPFIARWPGVSPEGVQSDAMVSFVDIKPTFLEIAGLERPGYLAGHSLVPVLDGSNPEGTRRYLLSAYVAHTTGVWGYWPARSINDGRFKLIHHVLGDGKTSRHAWHTGKEDQSSEYEFSGPIGQAIKATGPDSPSYQALVRSQVPPAFELFDLHNDPAEVHNLADDPDHAEIMDRLKVALENWQMNIVFDPFVEPQHVEEFTEDYARKLEFYREHRDEEPLVEGMSRLNMWGGWTLDWTRWTPEWDPAGYTQDPAR